MRKSLNNVSSESLYAMLHDSNPIIVCEAICEIVKRKSGTIAERDALREACINKNVFWNNYLISDFAEAALDLLGWDRYSGNRYEVIRLIESKLVFD